MTTISLKIPSVLQRRLADVAQRKGTSRSAVIREALEQYIAGHAKRDDSCLALAGDLIGCVKGGPADLSTNRKYMAGFGK